MHVLDVFADVQVRTGLVEIVLAGAELLARKVPHDRRLSRLGRREERVLVRVRLLGGEQKRRRVDALLAAEVADGVYYGGALSGTAEGNGESACAPLYIGIGDDV